MSEYYKVTNVKEVHYGYQYTTGLNIDPSSYGMHYTNKENIEKFLSYGFYIRKVTIPADAIIQTKSSYIWSSNKLVLEDQYNIFDPVTIIIFNLENSNYILSSMISKKLYSLLNWYFEFKHSILENFIKENSSFVVEFFKNDSNFFDWIKINFPNLVVGDSNNNIKLVDKYIDIKYLYCDENINVSRQTALEEWFSQNVGYQVIKITKLFSILVKHSQIYSLNLLHKITDEKGLTLVLPFEAARIISNSKLLISWIQKINISFKKFINLNDFDNKVISFMKSNYGKDIIKINNLMLVHWKVLFHIISKNYNMLTKEILDKMHIKKVTTYNLIDIINADNIKLLDDIYAKNKSLILYDNILTNLIVFTNKTKFLDWFSSRQTNFKLDNEDYFDYFDNPDIYGIHKSTIDWVVSYQKIENNI